MSTCMHMLLDIVYPEDLGEVAPKSWLLNTILLEKKPVFLQKGLTSGLEQGKYKMNLK